MLRRFFITILMVAMVASGAAAEQLVVAASEATRVVNPNDSGDVRLLYKFDMPELLSTSDIVLAVLRISTNGQQEAPIVVGKIESAWSPGEGWTSLSSTLGESEAYAGDVGHGIVTSNHLESSAEGIADLGIEVAVTEMVSAWTSRSENYGLCVRGVSGRDDDLTSILSANVSEPELLILYTSK